MAEIALRQIRAIIAVAEEGSFTRAAARENATQSGISQHVAAAERTLGVKLFERSAAGVKPTPAGQRYYKRCVEAVEPACQRRRGGARLCRTRQRRPPHRPDPDGDARGAGADRQAVRHPAPGRPHPCRRRLQRLADGHGPQRRARLRRGAGLRGPRRPEDAADRARSRDAGIEREPRLQAIRARAAQGLRAAEDHPARPHQCPPPQHRHLFPDPRRRGRRDDRDGRHDQHPATGADVGLGGDPVGVDLRSRHRPRRRPRHQPDLRSAADRRIRGDLAGAAAAVDAGAAFPRGVRGGDRPHPGDVGADHPAGGLSGAAGAPAAR